jgi:hypothetical protein
MRRAVARIPVSGTAAIEEAIDDQNVPGTGPELRLPAQ